MGVKGPVLAVIMDGIGIGRGDAGDAVAQARTPNLHRYAKEQLTTALRAHGKAVGMPSDADMGNSEVGHNAMGAGRIFDQGAKRVAEAIADGSLFHGKIWGEIVNRCLHCNTALHFIGLLSDGNVHSHIDHLIAMLHAASSAGIQTAYVHVLLDGRDVEKTSALRYIEKLEHALKTIGKKNYAIASGGGRMTTTMDRYDADWSMVERGWHTHVQGNARAFSSARVAVETYRSEFPGIIDQDLPPFVIANPQGPLGKIGDGDAVIAFNFRGDRMIEMTRAFEDDVFDKFPRGHRPDVLFAGMTCYDGDTHRPKKFLVDPPEISGTLGELLCHVGVRQFACSETQKFGHVTYFWNGNRSGMFDPSLEDYVEIPSYAPPFDARPEMRAPEITQAVLKALDTKPFQFGRINFPNGDMVGHTGNIEATIAAVEYVDHALGILEKAILAQGGALLVTADHGNADDMIERDEKTGIFLRDREGRYITKTAHSLNPVPFHVVLTPEDRHRYTLAKIADPSIGHIAATCARLLGFSPPEGYLKALIEPG